MFSVSFVAFNLLRGASLMQRWGSSIYLISEGGLPCLMCSRAAGRDGADVPVGGDASGGLLHPHCRAIFKRPGGSGKVRLLLPSLVDAPSVQATG